MNGDVEKLVLALHGLSIRRSADPAWSRSAAVRVIDCVLSLNRNYDRFVVPRRDQFALRHPQVCSITDLKGLIATYDSPNNFVIDALNYRHESRAIVLAEVVNWMSRIAGDGSYDEQLLNLEQWARNAKPSDSFGIGIKHFGLAGFQYLRMLFGADTAKPDKHICDFVTRAIGHPITQLSALLLLEESCRSAKILVHDADTTIWESTVRGRN